MRHSRGAMLVDQRARDEALERERRIQLMGLAVRKRPRERPARPRRRFEAARPPAAVQVEVVHGGRADDRGGVGADIDDAGPGPQYAGGAEDREELERRGELVL